MAKPYWDIPRPVSGVNILLECADRYGLSRGLCLAGSGITPPLLEDAHSRVGAEQELRVIRNLLERLGSDQPLALEAGCRQHLTTFGMWGFTILSSKNLYEAMELGLRYIKLTSAFCRFAPALGEGEALLRADNSELPADVRDFLVERDIAGLVTVQRDLAPLAMRAEAMRFTHPAPSYAHRVQDLLGIAPQYGGSTNESAFPVELLALPLSQSHSATRQACEEECRHLLQRLRSRKGLAGEVRDRLARRLSKMPTMDALAAELSLNPKTLRRRLAEEGAIYSDLIDEVRRAFAEELLSTTRLPLEDISARLGYSEPSAFTRAFKRWRAVSPRDYRRKLQTSSLRGNEKEG